MKRLPWSPGNLRRGDFMPILLGSGMLFVSLPTFLILLLAPDRNSGGLGVLLLLLLGMGIAGGLWLLVLGVRVCSDPGSLAYRITHGRILPW